MNHLVCAVESVRLCVVNSSKVKAYIHTGGGGLWGKTLTPRINIFCYHANMQYNVKYRTLPMPKVPLPPWIIIPCASVSVGGPIRISRVVFIEARRFSRRKGGGKGPTNAACARQEERDRFNENEFFSKSVIGTIL